MSEDFAREITDLVLEKMDKFAQFDKLPAVQILYQVIKGFEKAVDGKCKFGIERTCSSETEIGYGLYILGETSTGYKTRSKICGIRVPTSSLLDMWPVFVESVSGDNDMRCFNEEAVMGQLKIAILQNRNIANDLLVAQEK